MTSQKGFPYFKGTEAEKKELMRKWVIIKKELSTTQVPLRVTIEKHEIEHKLLGLI